jgi:hypothetical protein
MAVNDARVQKFINDALAPYSSLTGCCDRYARAFRDLQALRRIPGNSLDEDLACAEHYMFAHQAVCSGAVSAAQMTAMVVGYDVTKGIAQILGVERFVRTTPNPTAPASRDSIRWGLRGVTDGSARHGECNGGTAAPYFNGDAYRYGSGYGY